MKAEKPYYLPVILLILMTTCDNQADPVTGEDLQNVVWKLDSLQTPAGKEVPTVARHTSIRFTEDMEIRVNQVCRDYDGSYSLGAGQSLSISLLDSTDALCNWGEWTTDFEALIAGALGRIENYQTDGNLLSLYSGQNDYLLYFSIEVRDPSLVNILWKLDTLQTATEIIVASPEDQYMNPITTVFYDSWYIAGAAPCTYIDGDYDLGNSGYLSISGPSRGWEILCYAPDEIRHDIFIDAFGEITHYAREGERLILSSDDRTTRLSYSLGAVDETLTKTLYPRYSGYNEMTKYWILDSLLGPEDWLLPDAGNNISLYLTKELGVMIVGINCGYKMIPSFLNLEPGALTFDMGPGYPDLGVCTELDSAFMDALQTTRYYDMNDNKLILRDSLDNLVVFFTGFLYGQD